ncbi:FAD-dependent oxidoreductase [Anaeromyxobacter oryzisoli]|uniref:FAD-dependent oxidoreductase n=1 Tax=Anaeromyxobacter oryzisoli TaxID=2925408 RepID=UPI001F57564C|nr:FAD-dependent oxidoreductase [Anaeromyxobacter sp. SG63]
MTKTFACTCEDVTLDEVRRAFALGHRDLESVKRYTGFGTGPCQGKSCLARVVGELLRLGATPGEVQPFTARAPVQPVAFGELAALDPATLPLDEGIPVAPAPLEHPPRAGDRPALPARADVVIVGGGIMGLALAAELATRGRTDVLVLEGAYLNAGASGRNGGGVRAQWATPTMIRLARRSLELCARFAVDMGVNVWFRRGGYLFLAPTPEQVARIERNAALQRREGLRTRVLGPAEALEVVPELDPSRFRAASHNPDDAVVFPWPFLWGYAGKAEALGAKVRTFTRVTGFETAGRRVAAVTTDRGRVACETVVVAAGAWSKQVAALAGVALPNRPTRHEILVTEPLKPWLDPLVSVLGTGLYFSQSQRGELVGGMGDPEEPEGVIQGSTLRFLARFARAATETVPALAGVKVVRQWAGCYDVTPDNNPILGPAGFENFHQLSGFVGHGFMMAPAVAELYADWLTGRGKHDIFDRFGLGRFDGGAPPREDFIIG